jgi:hypothetical protein
MAGRLHRCLDNPFVWDVSRQILDLVAGAYRKKSALMRSWGILNGSSSILDVGCV